MNILVVSQYYYPEQFGINSICVELSKRGHKVTVLTGLPNYPSGSVLEKYRRFQNRSETIDGVKVTRCFLLGRKKGKLRLALNYISFALSASIRVLLIKRQFDVIFCYQLSPATMIIPAAIFKKRSKKKLLIYALDLWPDSILTAGIKSSSIIYRILYSISKKLYGYADLLLYTSKSFEKYFREKLKLVLPRMEYLPQYAEDLFQTVHSNNKSVDTTHINLVFAGNIGEAQSVETAIKAVNQLKKFEVKLHIVGEGSALENCKRLVEAIGARHKVIFHGRQPIEKMPYYYSLADAMIVTLKKDEFASYTLPGKVQSYMAAGKAIIGSADGETSMILREAECGLCANSEDYIELAEKMVYFMQHPELKAIYEYNSRQYYQKHFEKNNAIDFLVSKLEILAAEGTHVS